MKHYFLITALALLPLGLTAQTKPAVRKPVNSVKKTTSVRPVSTKTTAAPVKEVASAVLSPSESTTIGSAPVVVQAQPVQPAPITNAKPATATRTTASARLKTSHFRIGIRAGGNLSTIGGITASADAGGASVQLARVTGFHGGLVFNIGGPTFSVQPEVLLSQYGIRLNVGSDYLQMKYNLIEVPVLLKLAFGSPNLRFFINAGPVATYAMSGTVSYREDGQGGSQVIILDGQGRFAYGGSGGAGITLKAGPGNVLLEGRYTYLMTNQADGSQTTPQSAMVSVGYLIPLGGR